MEEDKLTIVSKEGDKLQVSRKIIQMSQLFRDLFEDVDADSGQAQEDIPLDYIPTFYLRKIIEFCEHYNFQKTP